MSPIYLEADAWSATPATLPPATAAAISASGLAEAATGPTPGSWMIRTESKVGIAIGDDWELRVRPRLAIPRLMFLLAYSSDSKGWRDTFASFAEEAELYSAIASGFAVHAERAISPAPLAGYVERDETAKAFRGTLRVADQISKQRGLPMPLEITVDEFIPDIRENRVLLTATHRLLRLPLVPPKARSRLLRVKAMLDGVALLPPRSGVELPPITRLNARYEPALRLANLILNCTSISTEKGATESVMFMFDMNAVFEDFLSTALTSCFRRRGGHVDLQRNDRFLDAERRIRLKPDITWWRNGRCQAVIDAKYKAVTDARFPNADAYQMLAYATAFGLPRGHLVYAKDSGTESRRHRVATAGKTIQVSAVNVELEPDELLADVEALAALIAEDAHRPSATLRVSQS